MDWIYAPLAINSEGEQSILSYIRVDDLDHSLLAAIALVAIHEDGLRVIHNDSPSHWGRPMFDSYGCRVETVLKRLAWVTSGCLDDRVALVSMLALAAFSSGACEVG